MNGIFAGFLNDVWVLNKVFEPKNDAEKLQMENNTAVIKQALADFIVKMQLSFHQPSVHGVSESIENRLKVEYNILYEWFGEAEAEHTQLLVEQLLSKRYRKARKALLKIYGEFEQIQRFNGNSLFKNEYYPPQVLKQLKAFGLIGGDIHYAGHFSLSSRGEKIANLVKYWKKE